MSTGFKKIRVARVAAGATLQDAMSGQLGMTRNAAKRLIDSKHVFVNGSRVWMARHAIRRGDTIEVPSGDVGSAPPVVSAIRVLHEDPAYLVVDKPAGLVSNGPDSLETALQQQRSEPGLFAAHRLDRDTTGCLLFARNRKAFDAAVEFFKERGVTKVYRAIVIGRWPRAIRDIRRPLDGQTAVTLVTVLDSNPRASHLKLKIETGRTHQIRRHLAMSGFPLAGDPQYGASHPQPDALRRIPRQMLHAEALIFTNPFGGATVTARAPLPSDFKATLRAMGLE
jgi:RluA family pseudouridine synthase